MNIRGEILKYNNYLSIDDIPMNVVKLCFTNLKLRELPNLTRFKHLRVIHCSHNRLTSIDNLPDNIEYIFCSNNRITCINNLPYYLMGLFCNNNRIRYIKELPPYLMRLFCNDNCLTSIPDLPFLFEVLMCHRNPLYSLPYLPYSMIRLYCEIMPEIYPDRSLYTINVINNFRYNYFTLKYGHKLLFYLIKKRMKKNKRELLETSAKIIMNPSRISRILENGYHSIEDFADNL